jgi:DNA-binding XRE family transcriptional regulator
MTVPFRCYCTKDRQCELCDAFLANMPQPKKAGKQVDNHSLGYLITVRRTMLRMSRRDLAEASGLSYAYVSNMENGEKDASMASLKKVALSLKFPSVADMLIWEAKLEQFIKEEG